ncbi:uncharacterized protein CC84DRAFT_1252974 [Paraphaeosphaeria sporulosa]|uniref:Chitin-binding type-1 domain-containing protein n=1 Tax=Paraphaeosphaeria sporulosa TaxID=1460663 RepID=A0A177C450_9PLEO|nr:uncharacterized protein CC84DRAFT_1252974 [Paraphaeosphaeria sporulosa]OAG02275.1 hypothetical protein CC84DRAFT_1252974 [Paraphaeosphaeria sporulosa]
MRSTAVITLLSNAAMAASGHTITGSPVGEYAAYDGIVYDPPVTATITETKTTTQYDTITSYETTVTSWELAPPVTVTVTEYIDELFDQSYENKDELGDLVVAPTIITATKTFTLVAPNEEEPSMTELVNEWNIEQATSYATTVTEFTSTTWVHQHITSTIWVDEAKPTEEYAEDFDEEHPAEPTKTIQLEDGYGGLKEPQPTGSKSHVIDLPVNQVPNDEELEKLLADIWEAEQAAAEKAAQEAAKKVFESAAKGGKPTASPSSSLQAQPHKPSRPLGSTPTHALTPFHTPNPSSSPKTSTFATKTSLQAAPRPQPSVSAGKWKGELINTPDGTCGPKGGEIAYTCQGNSRGSCCSSYGHCGSEDAHCGTGCMPTFGTCSPAASSSEISHNIAKRSETLEKVHSEMIQKVVDMILADLELHNKNLPSSHGVAKRSSTPDKETKKVKQDLASLILTGLASPNKTSPHAPSVASTPKSEAHLFTAKLKQDSIDFLSWAAVFQKAQEKEKSSEIDERDLNLNVQYNITAIDGILRHFRAETIKTMQPYNVTELMEALRAEGELKRAMWMVKGRRKIGEEFEWNVNGSVAVNETALAIEAGIYNRTAAASQTAVGDKTTVNDGSVLARGTPLTEIESGLIAQTGAIARRSCPKWLWSCWPKTLHDAIKHHRDDGDDKKHDDSSDSSSDRE